MILSKRGGKLAQRLASGLGLVLLLPALLGFSACTPQTPQQTHHITLAFWTLQLATFNSTLEPMFLACEREHPDVRIEWVDVPLSEGPTRTLTAMMSGHTPDVINLSPDFSAVLANRNALVDMNTALPEQVKASYLPVA